MSEEEELSICTDSESFYTLIQFLANKEYVAYDVETNGVGPDSKIIGFSIAYRLGHAIYVPLLKYNKGTDLLEVVNKEITDQLPEFFAALAQKKLIMHNALFDCKMTKNNFGVDLMPAVHTDTMILAHILDENRSVGLKELAKTEFGEDSTAEKEEMLASVTANGGSITKTKYELYKADYMLIGKYGAKDALLTLKLFYLYIPKLFDEKLDKLFFEDECMPLLTGPTYDLNTRGLRVDVAKLHTLELTLQDDCRRLKEEILTEINPHIKDEYPGTNAKTTFNINSNKQLSWLLFIKLKKDYYKLTKKGKELAKEYLGKVPYNPSGKLAFIKEVLKRDLDPEKYIQCDNKTLMNLAPNLPWVSKLIDFKKADKMLKTYVEGIKSKLHYGTINPSFLQHGTTSGRYSSREPNFQNLPRDDKRIKECIVARPGMVFVGADYSQLEPRVFASVAQDIALLKCFEKNEDFYSVIGIPVFNKPEYSANKEASNYFGKLKRLRDNSKVIALSLTYGTTPYKMSESLRDDDGQLLPIEKCREIQASYFFNFPEVAKMIKEAHLEVKKNGVVYNLFGRPRHIPQAKLINVLYKSVKHDELPYEQRTLLNLAVNHKIQATAAGIINRAAIAFTKLMKRAKMNAYIVLQVHDELVVECREEDAEVIKANLKYCMEETVTIPGVKLIAEPKVGKNLAECK